MADERGRGAWSVRGKDNQSAFYEYVAGKPLDGSTPKKGDAYKAVNLGVKAIQNRINKEGYTPALVADGVLGAKTATAAKWFQAKYKLKADGVVGPSTCRMMWKKLILDAVKGTKVDPKYVYGQIAHESGADPGACGVAHAADRGINQINVEAHPDISLEEAHDPYFSMPYSVKRLAAAMEKYDGKGKKLQIECAIFAHNTPAGADYSYKRGELNEAGKAYVGAVLAKAADWEA